jgi:hypothetical protein
MAAPTPANPGAPHGCGTALLVVIGGFVVLMFLVSAISSHAPTTVPESPSTPHKASSPLADGQVKCSLSGLDSVSCQFESKGIGSAKACWNLVVECSGQRHWSHGCSALVPSGSTESYSFTLDPPILSQEQCNASRIEHFTLE